MTELTPIEPDNIYLAKKVRYHNTIRIGVFFLSPTEIASFLAEYTY